MLQAAEQKDKEIKEQDKLNRTARVQPTPQTKDPDGPNAPSTDRRKYEPAQKDFYHSCFIHQAYLNILLLLRSDRAVCSG